MTNEELQDFAITIPAWVRFHSELKANEKFVLATILTLENRYGVCNASNKFLAKANGMNENTIRRYIWRFQKIGVLIVSESEGKRKLSTISPQVINLAQEEIQPDPNVINRAQNVINRAQNVINLAQHRSIYNDPINDHNNAKSDRNGSVAFEQVLSEAPLPPNLDTPIGREALRELIDHKRSNGSAWKSVQGAKKLFRNFKGYTDRDFEQAVNTTIAGNYKGCFPPKRKRREKSATETFNNIMSELNAG